MKKNIYELALHESMIFETVIENNSGHGKTIEYLVTRVPGGWGYVLLDDSKVNFFVPFNEEFK